VRASERLKIAGAWALVGGATTGLVLTVVDPVTGLSQQLIMVVMFAVAVLMAALGSFLGVFPDEVAAETQSRAARLRHKTLRK
jgi:hypothetical protein